MKKTTLLIFALLAIFFINAQQPSDKALPKSYLFDHFIKGSVLSKSGAVDEAPLNYNADDQSIVFLREGQTFILTNLETIDTIYIQNRKFVAADNIFYEVLTDLSEVSLFVTYHSKTRPLTAISNHDSTTRKAGNDVSNAVTDVYVTRPFNGDNLVEIQKRYWLGQGNSKYKANTQKQFIKVFSPNESAIKLYIKESNINFSNSDDLIKLVAFGNNLLVAEIKVK